MAFRKIERGVELAAGQPIALKVRLISRSRDLVAALQPHVGTRGLTRGCGASRQLPNPVRLSEVAC